jgi:hypothetical protein
MGILNDLSRLLFGNKTTAAGQSLSQHLSRWEKERQERMQVVEGTLKPWVLNLLKEKGELTFSWESGNDEAFVTFDAFTEAEENNFMELEEYMVDRLEIPDAGEFQMNGSGTVYMDGGIARVKYTSVMKEIVDYNEKTDEVVYGEEMQDGGERMLFAS